MQMLYVEDNRLNALLFEEIMRLQGGVELRVAEDAQHALSLVAHWTPDVIVLDAQLPGRTGFELLEELRRQPWLADVPALMCSADFNDELVVRAQAAGFCGYWGKPLDLAQVMADLERLRQAAGPPR